MGLGFGLLSGQLPAEAGHDWAPVYKRIIRLAEHSETVGLDSIWVTEHHFVDDGYMPSLLAVCAALAAKTNEITIGTAVLLAPLHHPLRLAEDAATVQLLADGRFVLGLGLGWSPIEYSAFGASRNTRGAAMEEILRILPRAWSGEPFRHDGPVYSLPEVGVRPTPGVKIPVIVGGAATPAIRRAARLADGVFLTTDQDAGLAGSESFTGGLIQQVRVACDELDRLGRDPGDFSWWCYLIMYPCSDPDVGWLEIRDHIWQSAWKYSDMVPSATRPGPPSRAPAPDAAMLDTIRKRDVLLGPADQIVESLGSIRELTGVPIRFVAKSCFPTLSLAPQLELIDRLAEEIAPYV